MQPAPLCSGSNIRPPESCGVVNEQEDVYKRMVRLCLYSIGRTIQRQHQIERSGGTPHHCHLLLLLDG